MISSLRQRGAISLLWTAILMMLLALIALSALYKMRFGRLPMQDSIDRWHAVGQVVSKAIQGTPASATASAHADPVAPDALKATTLQDGVKSCIIQGRTVFSDSECSDHNPTTRRHALHDSNGMRFAPPASAAHTEEDAADHTIQQKMVDRLTH